MRLFNHGLYLLAIVLFIISCQKNKTPTTEKKSTSAWAQVTVPENFFKEALVPGVANYNGSSLQNRETGVNATAADPISDPNNGDDPVILGAKLNNPYSLANMQEAYNTLYGSGTTLSANHLYVRFKPANATQIETLEDSADLELQDYPMDYTVIQEGDYYQDPALGTEDISWLYTVVPVGYSPPAGIQYQVIESIYIPNNDLLLEDMAESMAAGVSYSVSVQNNSRVISRTDKKTDPLIVPNLLPVPCDVEPCGPGCPLSGTPECGSGGGGGGNPPPNDPKIPRGQIQVRDIRTCNTVTTPITNVAVRQVRVVCKRWFKIEKLYTDDNGAFVSGKRFKNKVKVIVKTKNNNAKVAKIRGVRLWQILFPVKKRIGVFDQGAMSTISYIFTKPNPTSAHDKELPYWVAATTHNSVIEFRQYATEFGIGQPPAKMKILVTNWGFQRAAGATTMWNKCSSLSSDFSTFREYIEFFISLSTYVSQVNLFGYLKNQMDIVIGYAALNGDYNCRLTSNQVKHITYHELGHASHYARAGCDFWQAYRTRISNEITLGNPNTRPYGNGSETNAGLVAIGEMWGNHCEYIFTNRHYGNGGANGTFGNGGFTARLQGTDWQNVAGGLNCNLNAIENFNPSINLAIDPHRWIPQGVCYDLIDPAGEVAPVVDNITGYTNQQCFNALQSDVRSVPAFRNRLLLQNGNNQAVNVNNLFFRYGY